MMVVGREAKERRGRMLLRSAVKGRMECAEAAQAVQAMPVFLSTFLSTKLLVLAWRNGVWPWREGVFGVYGVYGVYGIFGRFEVSARGLPWWARANLRWRWRAGALMSLPYVISAGRARALALLLLLEPEARNKALVALVALVAWLAGR